MSTNFTIYRSSAGSGKTHTLVKEYIRLSISGIEYKKRFSKILAITFTNKAAAEMKERVIKNLHTLKLPDSHKNYNETYLNEMADFCNLSTQQVQERSKEVFATILHNYHLLKITTIDKFIVSLVYSFARDLKIDADHEIITDVNEIIDAGIDLLLEQSGRDEELTKLFIDFLGFEMAEGNKFNVKKELRKFCSKVMDEKGYEALELSKQHSEQEFIDACKIASDNILRIENKVKEVAKVLLDSIAKENLVSEDFYYKGRGNHSWIKNIAKGGFYKIETKALITDFINDPLKRWQKKIEGDKKLSAQRIENIISQGMQELLDLRAKEGPKYIVHKSVRDNAFSMALFRRLYASITEYKTSNSIILLSEFTQMVSAIISEEPAPFIYERLGERVKNIFVDEFQDTSAMQFENLIPLIENSLSTQDFTMVVGDAKQSIYRWRNGNVEQFINLATLPANALRKHPYRQQLFKAEEKIENLPVNYRSLVNIVEFNNLFFASLISNPKFSSEVITKAYKEVKQEAIATKVGGYVEFEMLLKEKKPSFNKDESVEDDDEEIIVENDPRIIFTINSISKSLANGYNFNDIALLVRTHKEGERLFTGLKKASIPVVSNQALSFEKSLEIKSIIHFLECLQYESKFKEFKKFAYTYARYLNKFDEYENAIAGIDFTATIQTITELFKLNFVRQLFFKLNLYEQIQYISSVINIPENNSFLVSFYELVFNYYKRAGSGVHAFLSWWEQKSAGFKLQTGQSTNSVNIVTIHKSKGMQYPIVIIPYLKLDSSFHQAYFWLNKVPGYDIKPLQVPFNKLLADTTWNEEYELEKQQKAFDQLNLIYVAFTRAEEQLFCFFEASPKLIETNPFVEALTKFGWNVMDRIFKFGSPVIKTQNNLLQEIIGPKEINKPEFKSWYSKLRVSTFQTANKHSSQELRNKGILIHSIAASIIESNEIENVISGYIVRGVLGEAEAKLIGLELNDFMTSKIYLELAANSSKQLCEFEIVDEFGAIHRPDRIFIQNNKVTVLDLKTGEEEDEHLEQVAKYQKLLLNTGFTNCGAYIYYFKSKKWIKVN